MRECGPSIGLLPSLTLYGSGCEPLTPDDIAEVVVFAVGRRENVVLADTLIFPNHQVSVHLSSTNFLFLYALESSRDTMVMRVIRKMTVLTCMSRLVRVHIYTRRRRREHISAYTFIQWQ